MNDPIGSGSSCINVKHTGTHSSADQSFYPFPPNSKEASPGLLFERGHGPQLGSHPTPPEDRREDVLVTEHTTPSSSQAPGPAHVEGLGIVVEEDNHVAEDQAASSIETSKYFLQKGITKISQITNTLARQRDKAREGRVASLLQLIDDVRRGLYDSDPREAIDKKILPGDYGLFQAVLKRQHHEYLIQKYDAKKLRQYIKHDLKYEYIPSTRGRQQFRILMQPSTVHNFVERYWEGEIKVWLRGIEENTAGRHSGKTIDLVKAIKSFGSDDVKLPGETKCRPDCCWEIRYPRTDNALQKPKKGSWPSMVMEVVWAHPLTQKKIDRYILKSNGAIRTIVSIDLGKTYRRWGQIKKKWKVDGINRGPVDIQSPVTQVCGKDGALVTDKIACFSLRDFVPERDEGRTKMSTEELQDLEGLILTLDAKAVMDGIDVALEKQKEKDEENNEEEEDDEVGDEGNEDDAQIESGNAGLEGICSGKEISDQGQDMKMLGGRSYHLVFIDEAGFDKPCVFWRKGRAVKGVTSMQKAKFQQHGRLSMLATFTQNGVKLSRFIYGSVDKATFEDFIDQLLRYYSRWPEPESVLIMDNVGFHYSDRVQQMSKSAGVKSDFIAPYTPRTNSIEEFFGQVKAQMKLRRKDTSSLVLRLWVMIEVVQSVTFVMLGFMLSNFPKIEYSRRYMLASYAVSSTHSLIRQELLRDNNTRINQGLDSVVRSAATMKSMLPLSESDFCQHFAEAVIAGALTSQPTSLELTSGLVKIESRHHEAEPLLSHYTRENADIANQASANKPAIPLNTQLANARGRREVILIIHEFFLLKLSSLFQIEFSKPERAEPKTLRLNDLDIDSLMALEIRTWFVKTLQVNIPMLKILNGAIVADLIDTAVDTLPRSLVPKLDDQELGPLTNERARPTQNSSGPPSQKQKAGNQYSQETLIRPEQSVTNNKSAPAENRGDPVAEDQPPPNSMTKANVNPAISENSDSSYPGSHITNPRSPNFSIGIGDANRTEEHYMGGIGDFINILPLVFNTHASLTFDAVLQETRSKTYTALTNSRVPFQVLLHEQRSEVTTPIFQAFMDYRLAPYDVAVDIVDNPDSHTHLTFIVRDDLYSQMDVERLAKSYTMLAEAFVAEPSATLGQAEIFDGAEIEEALNVGRGPLYESRQWGSTAIHQVDAMAERYSKTTAVIAGDGRAASYDEVVRNRVGVIASKLEAAGEIVLQQSSQGFDTSLMQIFTALCFGGTLCLLPRKFRGDARAISETITRYSVTHTYGTPSECFSWLKYGNLEALRNSSWKTALVGGEQLTTPVLKEFSTLGKDGLRFYHMYGTTESTFCAAVTELDYVKLASEDASATSQPNYAAGVALPNYNVYILDEQRKPLPMGFLGEISIGGAGVAQGYLNNSSLTSEKFVPNPYATADDHARGWNMMQRTGDLGRWSRVDHGTLLVEGCISGDTMMKIRGVTEVIASSRRNSPELPEFLIAHVVFEKEWAERKEEHEHYLQQLRERLELPLYTLYTQPAFIFVLDSLPLMASAKLGHRAVSMLTLPESNNGTDNAVCASVEKKLKVVWEDVLSCSIDITPATDFFHIGGTSLSLLSLRQKIRSQFNVDLTLLDLFEASVLANMARRIEGQIHAPQTIDWNEETGLRPPMLEIDNKILQQIPRSHSRVVILTGGSGHLGKALIKAMMKDSTVGEIHCLGVRNIASRTELKGLGKVTLYEGDLCQPRMGLSQSVIDDLFSRADVCVHRPTLISRDDIPELDGMHNILGYARKLGAIPESKGVARGVVNLVPLETVITGVLKCVLRDADYSSSCNIHERGEVHFVNHTGNLNLSLDNMRKWALDRTADGDIGFSDVELVEIPPDEWVRRASELGDGKTSIHD
ncbi:hypothetical protein GQX73_g10225 [Xylaria multiplex]|uniref:Carrier domain-containing protein n=1 Tax=Xylaria multiplex TaxID=323545 RepID=A0A7C8IGU6_9PEZI|nr:hypothetical protein GQX73_g10225 [Xylaria multiplex]